VDERKYLLQEDFITDFVSRIGTEQWQVVYQIQKTGSNTVVVYSALISPSAIPQILQKESWELHIGNGLPGFSEYWDGEKRVISYHRYGGPEGIRPFVIVREFHGAWPSYPEICEEFRHYHNLAESQGRSLLDFDESGYEIVAAKLQENLVTVRIDYLKQFLAGTQLALAVYFVSTRFSSLPLEEIPVGERSWIHQDESSFYRLDVVESDWTPSWMTMSQVMGKVVIFPPPIEKAGQWPFDENEEDRDVEFIIGVDEDGKPITYTSNPNRLANYFGANPDAPHYLTPVFFRKEVLTKYFADPDRYTVSDGYLRCLGLWGLRIDNNHPTHVVVFLGDLGRDLPYAERLHWKQFNVPPEGTVSEVTFRRGFLAQFTDPTAPDLRFRQEYKLCVREWEERFGWPLFKPLRKEDAYLLETVHVPVTNSQSELDAQILALAKLLVDSLNEKEIHKVVRAGPENEKGISKFERFLKATGFPSTKSVIQLFRDVQALRSSSVAHRKGKEYQKMLARLGVDLRNKPDVMKRLLEEASMALRKLREYYTRT